MVVSAVLTLDVAFGHRSQFDGIFTPCWWPDGDRGLQLRRGRINAEASTDVSEGFRMKLSRAEFAPG